MVYASLYAFILVISGRPNLLSRRFPMSWRWRRTTSSPTRRLRSPSIPCSRPLWVRASRWGKSLLRGTVSNDKRRRTSDPVRWTEAESVTPVCPCAERFQAAERSDRRKTSDQMDAMTDILHIKPLWSTRDVSLRVHGGFR